MVRRINSIQEQIQQDMMKKLDLKPIRMEIVEEPKEIQLGRKILDSLIIQNIGT